MKKLTILFIAILIPLLAAFFVGRYAYTDRYSADNFASAPAVALKADLFAKYMEEGKATQEKLELYLQFRTIEFNPTPIFSQTIQNNQDKNLYHVDIYTSIYKTIVNEQNVERLAFTFHVYNVQYETIRDTFVTEDHKGVLESPNPRLVVVIESPNGELSFRTTLELGVANNIPIVVDTGRDIEDTTAALIGDAKAGIKEWQISSAVVNINTILVLGGQNVEQTISTFTVDTFDTNMNNVNRDDYQEGYNGSYEYLGINRAVFLRYVWWQSMLTFLVIGLITISFYVVWNAEVKAQEDRLKKIRTQKASLNKKTKK